MNASRYYNDGERRLSGLRSAPSTKSSVESEPEWLLYEYEHPAYKNRVQAYSNVNIRGLLAGVTYPMKVRQIEGLATAYEAQRLAQQMANPNMTEQDLYNIVGALIRRDYCCVMKQNPTRELLCFIVFSRKGSNESVPRASLSRPSQHRSNASASDASTTQMSSTDSVRCLSVSPSKSSSNGAVMGPAQSRPPQHRIESAKRSSSKGSGLKILAARPAQRQHSLRFPYFARFLGPVRPWVAALTR